MFAAASVFLMFVPATVVYLWAVAAFPWVAVRKRWLAWGLIVIQLAQGPVYWLVVHTQSRAAAAIHFALVCTGVWMALTSLPLAVVRLASRSIRRRTMTPEVGGSTASSMRRRQIIEAAAGTALFGATGTMIGWGITRGRHEYQLREVPVRMVGLPRALDGYVIAQVSDIHTGEYVDARQIDEGLAFVRLARPDLIVVTGDLVDYDPALARLIARKLADLPARDGVCAVLGNHDYYAGAEEVAQALRACGIDTLINEGKVIARGDGGGFSVLGVDDLSSSRHGRSGPSLDRALKHVPAALARVLLSHQPPTVDRWAGRVNLQLSGHTHGGQINPGSVLLNPLFEYVAGSYAVRGTHLYVNRGFGTVGPPARVGAPPEIARIVLIAA
jgi:predicted MPP superfamily phosphohydrolase